MPCGSFVDARVNVCVQSEVCASSGFDVSYALPGPAQISVEPSPINHSIRSGVAVTVADSPGTAADAERGCHESDDTHNHVGTCTNWSRSYGGDVWTPGKNNGRVLRA